MAISDVREEVREFIALNYALADRMGELEDETSLMEAGIIDSTGIMELVAFLEETYSLKINDDELVPENLDSVANVCEFVARKSASVPSSAAAEG